MSVDEKLMDRFDKYIRNDMPEEDRGEFEDLLAQEPSIQTQFTSYKDGIDALKIVGVKNQMNAILKKKQKVSRTIKLTSWTLAGIAASIVIVIGSLYIFAPKESLFDQYFEPYPDITSVRKGNMSSELERGYNFYNSGEYNQAINRFENILPQSDTLLFYCGLSYLSLNKPTEALHKLNRIQGQSIFQSQIHWYKGMAFLLMTDIDSVRIILESFQPNDFKYNKSKELLDQLKK